MSKLFFSTIILAVTMLFVQCQKEGGVTGPEGPKGEQGDKGDKGDKGATGNANVKVDTFRITNTQWLYNSNYIFDHLPNGWTWATSKYYDRSFTAISQDVLNTGMVLCYMTPSLAFNSNNWLPLPYTMMHGSSNYFYNFAGETSQGKIRLHYFYTANTQGATIPNVRDAVIATHKFKIVAITGAISSGRMMNSGRSEKQFPLKGKNYTETELKAMPYNEVCSLLDIAP